MGDVLLMNRRQFMAMLAAGAVVTADGLWMPGRKLISIPSRVSIAGKTPLDVWLSDGPITVRSAVIYADRTSNGYDAPDLVLHNQTLRFDSVWVSNPTGIGPDKLLVHHEPEPLEAHNLDITVQWGRAGVLGFS